MKKLTVLLLLMLNLNTVFSQSAANKLDSIILKKIEIAKQNLKDFSFCHCLEISFQALDSDYLKTREHLDELKRKEDINAFINYANSVKKSPYTKLIDSLFLKDGSSGGYFDKIPFNEEMLDSVRSMAKKWALKKYKSYHNEANLHIMKCLDFYNSPQLQILINGFGDELKKYYLGK